MTLLQAASLTKVLILDCLVLFNVTCHPQCLHYQHNTTGSQVAWSLSDSKGKKVIYQKTHHRALSAIWNHAVLVSTEPPKNVKENLQNLH